MPRRREAAPGPTATTRLTERLRRQVLTGELGPGSALREEDLAASTGASRHTVRAALARLAEERLVVAEAYRGVRVTAFADDDVVALQQLRGALEGEAVRLLQSEHGTAWPGDVLAPARAAVEALAAAPADDWPAVATAHAQVHLALVSAAGSPRISQVYARLHSEVLLLLVHVRPAYDVAALAAEHTAYLDDVQRRGAAAVREHLGHSTALILAARG
ncbi:DNA-binding transcriptional regulator, GntR family [Klenkia marina]|uniref:DNA-binding transcriptional regulator, GntR family n=1 Tax=Klenkia marina TaxID=1960309 RepID=A0A1G4YP23_9ACTN|nr:GntR family transcriptional regulator [Klenkia marina]SCX55129.1 DNA-binding transcriptional regulator, GntR family [Klenkia marina]